MPERIIFLFRLFWKTRYNFKLMGRLLFCTFPKWNVCLQINSSPNVYGGLRRLDVSFLSWLEWKHKNQNMAAGWTQVREHSAPWGLLIPLKTAVKNTWYESTAVTSNKAENHLVPRGLRLLRLLMQTSGDEPSHPNPWDRSGKRTSPLNANL